MKDSGKKPVTRKRISLLEFRSPVTFSLSAASLFLVLFNGRFWQETIAAFWHGGIMDGLFLLALLAVLLLLYAGALLLVPGRNAMIVLTGFLVPFGAMAAFCADSFGLPIDKEMIRSIGETDRGEALSLFSDRLVFYAVGLGVLPMFLVGAARIRPLGARQNALHRLVFYAAGLTLASMLAWMFAPRFEDFLRDHHHLRYLSVPGAALQGTLQYAHAEMRGWYEEPVSGPPGDPVRTERPPGAKPLLLFVVVGETARHMNFQLGGYARPTNPELSRVERLYYFRNVESCATTTAIALPCMFSHVGRERFNLSTAAPGTNALSELTEAGVEVEWRANNAGNNGVNARLPTTDFTGRNTSPLCLDHSCLDEIMLEGLEAKLKDGNSDRLVAFHQMGSHGPAYFRRYPQRLEIFRPACRSNDLAGCSSEEIRNAYDNTIAYTDHLLMTKIELLEKMSDRFDTALIYVSDHGESLGEKGIYLHGAPYAIAPEEQKRIPLIVWMSEGYMNRFRIDPACMPQQLHRRHSHDNLYHTILGAMGVKNAFYQRELDVIAACRPVEE